MRFHEYIFLVFLAGIVPLTASLQNQAVSCKFAFSFITNEFAVENVIQICTDSSRIPFQYEAEINLPVCDDTLCANVILKLCWDLAGNYKYFDTIPGKPLTKFDHNKFDDSDYQKFDQILKNRNSMLRILNKEDLIDKSIRVKSNIIDAVTGATPKTIKNSVVAGAVYSSYTLWHFVNGAVKEEMAVFTQEIYSEQVARRLLLSDNYETQLFALRKLSEKDFEIHSDLLFEVIGQSAPIIKAYIIAKEPLPYDNMEKNKQLIALFPELDDYSKSIFLNRITSEEKVAKSLLPLVIAVFENFSKKQQELITSAYHKFEIPGVEDLFKRTSY